MSTHAPTPDTPRPERTLPTAAWPPTAQGEPLGVACRRCHYGQSPSPADGVLMGACPECGFDLVPLEDVCRIYDAEQAQLAAGQALADHLRAVDDAIYAQDSVRVDRLLHDGAAIRRRLFAAFPPAEKGGAR